MRHQSRFFLSISFLIAFTAAAQAQQTCTPTNTVTAEVVALDQPFMFNRLGSAYPQGMIFALQRDVVDSGGKSCADGHCQPGQVMLRPDKRPRPIVLRANVGQCLQINFTNLLAATASNGQSATRHAGVHITGMELAGDINSDATFTGKNPNALAGNNTTDPASPQYYKRTYTYFAKAEGGFMLYSAAGDWAGQIPSGLFGSVAVQPANAEWYRSQVTREDLRLASYFTGDVTGKNTVTIPGNANMSIARQFDTAGKPVTVIVDGQPQQLWTLSTAIPENRTVKTAPVVVIDQHLFTQDGRPLVNYGAVYPSGHTRAGAPILSMTDSQKNIVHTDLTAIITGPNAGRFPYSDTSPTFNQNPASPDRRQPYREIAIHYHEVFAGVQAFEAFFEPGLEGVIGSNGTAAGSDQFAINYGAAGITAEVVASRMGVGPMGGKDSVDLKFEEFFLSSWANGDPAMVVDRPANAPNQIITNPANGQKTNANTAPYLASTGPGQVPIFQPTGGGAKATKAFYPDDPSNVYHSYIRDHVKFRILHTGGAITHVHHLHAHQWLRTPNSDDSHYLDSQVINPGTSFTTEMVYNGSGNRNQVVGDAIFHCHFYPHFAGGMWSLWRNHDVFEAGTKLDGNGIPVTNVPNRAYPDAEIEAGTPIPAIVPLPTLGMAPAPAPVKLIDNGRRVEVLADASGKITNPGYPFFVPGMSGHRAPHPPLDFAWEEDEKGLAKLDAGGQKILLDGGLPRHLVLGGKIVREFHTRWDFSKDFIRYDKSGKPVEGGLTAFQLPENGTAAEKAAMAAHATRTHASFQPDGDAGNFILNGLPPTHGAPYADPAVDDNGNAVNNVRRYQGAVIQTDVVLNKKGWHFPQQRMMSLWQDVKPTFDGVRPPQPFFFRVNTGETIQFWHTNLVPDYYKLDDFQVRTPTDIIGQHIHLVKFDVTSSDGGGNGWNYEDGTFSPDEVRGRINAINLSGGLFNFDERTQFKGNQQTRLTIKPAPSVFGQAPAGQDWSGAQTTIQRWDTDPLLNNKGEDRTMRTVFTHDHFGPSTHQQIGLYGGLLIEPENSKWFDPVSGEQFYTRKDGGPTSWQANIITTNQADSYREFALEFGDFQLAYAAGSPSTPGNLPGCDSSKADYPQKGCSALFMSDLMSAALPPAPKGKAAAAAAAISPGLWSAFARNGVVLSAQATVTASKPDEWKVADPAHTDDQYQFVVKRFLTLFDLCKLPGAPTNCADLVKALNAGNLSALSGVLTSAGIAQTTQTQIKTIFQSKSWQIINPVLPTDLPTALKPAGNPQPQIFAVNLDPKTQALNVTGLRVFTPNTSPTWAAPSFAINAPGSAIAPTDPVNPNNGNGAPYPSIISVVPPPGTFSLNYRNEPIPLRVTNPATGNPAAGQAGDLSFAFSSAINRADAALNQQPTPGTAISTGSAFKFPPNLISPTINGAQSQPCSATIAAGQVGKVQPCDPFTPLLRAYSGDKVQIRTLVGSQHNPHYFSLHGLKWLSEPTYTNSGYRNFQTMGISEHYEMLFSLPHPTSPASRSPFADYLYQASSGTDGLTNGMWGLMRSYNQPVGELKALPNNSPESLRTIPIAPPAGVQPRVFNIVATTAAQALPNGVLTYNSRGQKKADGTFDTTQQIINPNAILYVRAEDLDSGGKLKTGVPVEPLILRAAAGDWIQVNLTNSVNASLPTFTQTNAAQPPFGAAGAAAVNLQTSTNVGLHAQLVGYDVTTADGTNAGFNPIQTVAPPSGGNPGQTKTVYWYAGNLSVVNGQLVGTPVEFGSVGLNPSDPIWQHPKGMVGALIVEPQGSRWVEDSNSRASATVTKADGTSFRDFVLISQDDATLFTGTNAANANAYGSSSTTLNYGTEPMPYRYPGGNTGGDVYQAASNSQVGGQDPQTPIFTAAAGRPVRFRMLHPASGAGNNDGNVITIDGHVWQEEPFTNNSRLLGSNPLSQWQGTRGQHGARHKFEVLLDSAGGTNRVPGDYIYRSLVLVIGGGDPSQGFWGIFRVTREVAVTHQAESDQNGVGRIAGTVMAEPGKPLSAKVAAFKGETKLGEAPINADGSFQLTLNGVAAGETLRLQTSNGATYSTKLRATASVRQTVSPVAAPQN